MRDPNRSARDPIFYLHHANIDRLWEVWLANAAHSNPVNEAVWMNQKFILFDENKNPFTIAIKDLLDTKIQLKYIYNDPPRPVATLQDHYVEKTKGGDNMVYKTVAVLEPKKLWELTREPLHITIKLSQKQSDQLKPLLKKEKLERDALVLVIDGITYEGEVADSPLEVYLGAQRNAKFGDLKDPHFAHLYSFFGKVTNASAIIHLGEALGRLRGKKGFQLNEVPITINRHWFGDEPPANPQRLTFKKISLLVHE